MRQSPDTQNSAAQAARRPARILVVDDDPDLCGLHAEVMEMEGYEIATSYNGLDALDKLASDEFDLVLTDRNMPGLDGASMILALRSAGSRIPVVIVSGSLTQTPLPPGVARQVSAALSKPARMDEVIAAVAQALDSEEGKAAPETMEVKPTTRS